MYPGGSPNSYRDPGDETMKVSENLKKIFIGTSRCCANFPCNSSFVCLNEIHLEKTFYFNFYINRVRQEGNSKMKMTEMKHDKPTIPLHK